MLDFNKAIVSAPLVSVTINELIERAEPPEENTRPLLSVASAPVIAPC